METRTLSELKPHPINADIYGDGCDTNLRDNIKAKGILTPLIITSEKAEKYGANVIISGHRRFNASQMLQLSDVPVNISPLIHALDIDEAVIDANRQRDKTNEQKAREFSRIKEIERERAKERLSEAGVNTHGHRHQNLQPVEIFPQAVLLTNEQEQREYAPVKTTVTRMPTNGKGKSRDIAAKKIGISGKSAEKAEKVVRQIDTLKEQGDTETAEELRQTLNKSIDGAYKAVKKVDRQEPQERKTSTVIKKITFNPTNDNIEWAKWTWNPVTGCKHGCKYCYARDIAKRFTGHFNPEFHEDRLNAPQFTRIPEKRKDEPGIHNVFVCSMADLFGEWVPDEWIQRVMEQVKQYPQWNFLFLTKNPKRYLTVDFPVNCWVGASADTQERMDTALEVFRTLHSKGHKPTVTFTSCEPLSEEITLEYNDLNELSQYFDWLIIGGRSKSSGMAAGQPEWSWVEKLLFQSRTAGLKLYFKPNLTVKPKEYPTQM